MIPAVVVVTVAPSAMALLIGHGETQPSPQTARRLEWSP